MHTKLPILMALLSAALFGSATPASKFLLDSLTPFQLAGLLYLGAVLAVAPVALRQGALALPRRTDRPNQLRLLGAVLFGGVLGPVALLGGLRLAEATSVSMWLNLELAATAVLGAWLFRDHLSSRGWGGVVLMLIASLLLSWTPGAVVLLPALLVLIACICWGLDNHLTALIDGITPAQSTLWKGAVAGSVNMTIGWTLAPLDATIAVICAALLVGALSYGASIVLYIQSAQWMGATRAQVVFSTAPVFGVGLAIAVLGESFTLTHAVAAPFFIGAVVLLLVEGHSHEHKHKRMTHKHSHRHDDGHHNHVHPGLPARTRHSHWHEHPPVDHKHPHWPDLHHRHLHDSSSE